MKSIVIPTSVKVQAKRQAEEVPIPLTAQERQEFLVSVPSEFVTEAEGYIDELTQRGIEARSDWRDRTLVQIVTLLSRLSTTIGTNTIEPAFDGDESWMECDEVARYLHLSPKAVRVGSARGSLPAHKYPPTSPRGRWRFRKSEIDELLLHPKRKGGPRKGVSLW